jgi:hypothetical protein
VAFPALAAMLQPSAQAAYGTTRGGSLLRGRLGRRLRHDHAELLLDVRHEVAVHRVLLSCLRVVHVHRRRPVVTSVAGLPRLEEVGGGERLNDDGRPGPFLDYVVGNVGVGGELSDRGLKVLEVGLVELGRSAKRGVEAHLAGPTMAEVMNEPSESPSRSMTRTVSLLVYLLDFHTA